MIIQKNSEELCGNLNPAISLSEKEAPSSPGILSPLRKKFGGENELGLALVRMASQIRREPTLKHQSRYFPQIFCSAVGSSKSLEGSGGASFSDKLMAGFRLLACFILLMAFIGCAQGPYQEARMLMGTLNEIQIYGLPKERARAAAEKGFAAMKRVDDLMSHYKATSEVSQIKNLLPMELLVVAKETFEVLARAQDMATVSNGAFDVTVSPLVKRWGFFDHIQKEIPAQEELKELRRQCGYEHLFLNPKTRSVQKRIPELEVDLGGIAKGYAIDLALAALKEAGVTSATVNSGGNLGFIGKPPKHLVWEVGIKDPLNPQEMIGVLTVEKGGVATSGDYEHYFEIEGKRYTHILDPRTGWPVHGIHSVTVIAPNAMDADALSTTLFVLGPEKGIPLAQKFGAQALFVLDKGEGKTELVFSPGLEDLFLKKYGL